MHDNYRSHHSNHRSAAVYVLLGLACMTVASCGFRPRNPERSDTELGREWPQSPRQPAIFREASYGVLRDAVPAVEGAEFVNDDELCLNCHKVYAESMQQNVHRGIGTDGHACEACHGPASDHLKTRGKEPGLLWNFRTMRPAQAAEVCLKCHEQDACSPGAQWRTSVHAHNNLTCTSCHTRSLQRAAGNEAHDRAGRGCSNRQRTDHHPGQLPGGEHHVASAGRPVRQHGCRRSGCLLPLPWRQAGHAADRRPAPDLWPEQFQLHDLPRRARQDPGELAAAAVLELPSIGLTDHGLAFVHARHHGSRLHRLPHAARECQRAADRRHQPL